MMSSSDEEEEEVPSKVCIYWIPSLLGGIHHSVDNPHIFVRGIHHSVDYQHISGLLFTITITNQLILNIPFIKI